MSPASRCPGAVGLALLLALTGCGQNSAEHPEHSTPPATATSEGMTSEGTTRIEASFVDYFDRPDSEYGLGDGWDLRGPYVDRFPLPAATDGFLRDGFFTYRGDDVVYAVRQFRSTVLRMGATGRWRALRDGAETTMTMALTANDKIVSDMVHLTVTRQKWNLTVRRGADFEPVANGVFLPELNTAEPYLFELAAADDSVTVRVPGAVVTTPVDTTGLLGDRAFWEEFPMESPSGTVFDFDTVWAAEAGQLSTPFGV